MKAIEILEREPERVARLHAITKRLREGLKARGFKPLDGESAIVPIIVGDTAFAIRMSQELLAEGIFITGFGYPVVPEGTARLRIQACASLTDAQSRLRPGVVREGREAVGGYLEYPPPLCGGGGPRSGGGGDATPSVTRD